MARVKFRFNEFYTVLLFVFVIRKNI